MLTGFNVLMVVTVKKKLMLYGLMYSVRNLLTFTGICCLHLQGTG